MPTRKPPPAPAPPPAKRPAHRPPYVPSVQERNNVESMTACGIPQRDICANLGFSLATLHKHFRVEINTGASKAVAMVAASLYNRAVAGDVPAMKYFLNNRAPGQWTERVTIVDGGTEVDPKELSDADLEARRRQLLRHPAVVKAERNTVH